jgi:hypothetical protein
LAPLQHRLVATADLKRAVIAEQTLYQYAIFVRPRLDCQRLQEEDAVKARHVN